ncbi:hypothetical protein K3152_10465 [Qipengyuania sp. 1NDH17]|uniref:Peptidase M48 domain-containing protein n=1 Tax=Qipengyuania polymorpha TaxID=2867234 RepID=A0ABS7J1N7_9SPHN|nr:hypothetical protein [Qipengyuania polymorpha]MBX7458667.1 hypothetical protein [Qipengyuania polymorpha]
MRAVALPIMLALVAAPAAAKAEEHPNPFAQFQQREGRLFDIGWQLARANRAFCPSTAPSIGLMIHDAANYARADEVRAALSLAGDIGVQAVASGSPAERAGVKVNRTLFAVDLAQVDQRWKPTRPTVKRTLQIEEAIAHSLEDGRVGLSFTDRGGETVIDGVETCAAKFRLTGDDEAYASADTVFFGEGFMGFGLPREVFAAAVAHELAHVIQGHARRKESERWGWRKTRNSEREADRMMPWLLFNAGYKPEAAADWMRAWGPKHSGGLLRKRTHDGWDERLAMIVAETAALKRLVAANDWKPGEADWSQRFPAAPAE